ncbi:hypothetical protein ACFOWA_01085 [Pedobacter lithocola]|uniref:Minor glycoprotein n=1 Tax=Pedobacter lithocola TaxID=1908239 RepID=A0ABV8P3D2_9SPHI
MKIGILLLALLCLNTLVFAADGCQVGTGPFSRVYITKTTRCTLCPSNSEPFTNGSNYIVFSNVATECNSTPYTPSTQYVKTGELTPRITSFGNSLCFTTNGIGFTNGNAVNYVRVYNCPIDDYAWLLLFPFTVFGVITVARQQITNK